MFWEDTTVQYYAAIHEMMIMIAKQLSPDIEHHFNIITSGMNLKNFILSNEQSSPGYGLGF